MIWRVARITSSSSAAPEGPPRRSTKTRPTEVGAGAGRGGGSRSSTKALPHAGHDGSPVASSRTAREAEQSWHHRRPEGAAARGDEPDSIARARAKK